MMVSAILQRIVFLAAVLAVLSAGGLGQVEAGRRAQSLAHGRGKLGRHFDKADKQPSYCGAGRYKHVQNEFYTLSVVYSDDWHKESHRARSAHQAHLDKLHAAGKLILWSETGIPVTGGYGVFAPGTTWHQVDEAAARDPFNAAKLIASWKVTPSTVIAGPYPHCE